ncbi:hypothetical protein DH2020_019008 [Rehmannia glutinosa]|uniref:DM2 domain-containing protein n=1 Tax=Rehmannia glutinosa TaxID=99300 RepID=A0ABR0WNA9_REHGL
MQSSPSDILASPSAYAAVHRLRIIHHICPDTVDYGRFTSFIDLAQYGCGNGVHPHMRVQVFGFAVPFQWISGSYMDMDPSPSTCDQHDIDNVEYGLRRVGRETSSGLSCSLQVIVLALTKKCESAELVPHLLSQSQPQGRPYFPGHFQPSEPQVQAFVQDQSQVQTQVMVQPQAPAQTTFSAFWGSSGQGTASPMKTMELAPAVRRGKRKIPDKVIPEKVAAILPESALYTQLLEFESRVDVALARKKIDIVESLKNPLRAQKVLRIYIFNTYANQMGTNSENENAEPPSWSLRIIGRILEDGKDPGLEGLGFEVKRKGDKEFTAIVRLEMNYAPEKFKLSPALQEVLGVEVETRSRIMTALWHYIKMRKLQIPGDTSSFMCDPPLRKVFGEEKLKFSMVTQKITPHLTPPGHIHLEHRIKLSGGSPAGNTCYDVLVDVPLLLEKEMSNFLANLEKNKEIDACDEAISSAMKKIHEHLRRRAFFLGFSQSPAEFINTLIASQARDLKLAAADASRDVEKESRAEFYNQPWCNTNNAVRRLKTMGVACLFGCLEKLFDVVISSLMHTLSVEWTEDAVIRYLNRKPAVGSEAAAGNK